MNISNGIRRITQLFLVLFLAMSAGLVYWQVAVADQVTSNPRNLRSCMSTSVPQRGRIFDRNGVLLADSQPDPDACGGFVRHYYEPSLAGLIGYYPGPYFLATGLEAKFDDYLSGRVGMTSLDNQVNKTLHRSPVGDDIYLTIDVRIQRILVKNFALHAPFDGVNSFPTNRGSAMVMDPHTGEVLAIYSSPGYDPNKMAQTLTHASLSYYNQMVNDPERPLVFRPTQGQYVPGSTYKATTLMAALDSGTTTLDRVYEPKFTHGPVTLGQHVLSPSISNLDPFTKNYNVSTGYGFAHSDNVLFAKIGDDMGVDSWLAYNKKFMVGEKIPFELPVAVSRVTQADGTLDENHLVDNAFGQGVDFVTPFQMAMINNIAANDGQLMQPTVLSKVATRDKAPVKTFSPQNLGDAQLKQTTAIDVRKAMYGVVQCGSGNNDFVPGAMLSTSRWGIIGKTGTAELGNGKPAHGWLITQAPYNYQQSDKMPTLTIVAMKENGGEGADAVGPVITATYNDIFDQGLVKADLPPPPPGGYCYTNRLLQ
ncbi:penicillin-binding protein [Ktedonobacter sp. SOSP1-85]|uniref:penicillin-binding transpeptidase domain-containing protein n=1 Tax=Ktedonobacter sp. SOSP1-85 TaxID=2778367 RepID=UPI00191684C8|nr:penicillin-binding transpeptidase domain-containing protein [Ktedonobacter sp. SOSP1-85]GHO74427.1 penicillin-binding protein [Ktedonobacter sp. SOSP1-85]